MQSESRLSQGEELWLSLRNSLSPASLKMICEMLRGVSSVSLTDLEIEEICNISDNSSKKNFATVQDELAELFDEVDDNRELDFDDYLVMYKIYCGDVITMDFSSGKTAPKDSIITNCEFTYKDRNFSKNRLSQILTRLDKNSFLNYNMPLGAPDIETFAKDKKLQDKFVKQKFGIICKLGRKGKKALLDKMSEFNNFDE